MAHSDNVHVVASNTIHYSFADEILKEPGGQHLFTCSPCGTCTGTCPIPRFDPSFNPRLLMTKATLGMREEVLSGPEIWQCSACDICYSRCPHQVHISDVMKAIRNIALREGYSRPGPKATVNAANCTACGRCTEVCPYKAISLQSVMWNRQAKMVAQVESNLCAGCGICSSACPSSSIAVEGHTDRELHEKLVAHAHALNSLRAGAQPSKILAIVCDWCLHARLDIQAASNPPLGVEVVRVPCSGRVTAPFVLSALQRGAQAVLTVGCKQGECHYLHGSDLEANQLAMLTGFMSMLGVDRRRVRFARMGVLDRGKLTRVIEDVRQEIAPGASSGEASRRVEKSWPRN